MPLLTEREHMQLWCPEARAVVFETREAPKVITADTPNVQIADASPTFNRLDFGAMGGLKIPQSVLCFGSNCGAWQWSNWHRGADGKAYPTREAVRNKDPNMNCARMGYCGKAAPVEIVMPPRAKVAPAANEPTEGETKQ